MMTDVKTETKRMYCIVNISVCVEYPSLTHIWQLYCPNIAIGNHKWIQDKNKPTAAIYYFDDGTHYEVITKPELN